MENYSYISNYQHDLDNLTVISSDSCSVNMTFYPNNVTVDGIRNCTANASAAGTDDWALPFGAAVFVILDTSIWATWIVIANVIVISSFFQDPKLRVIQNYYIVSLATSDLMMGVFVMPLGLYAFLHDLAWPIRSKTLCKLWNVMDFVNGLQSSFSVSLISYDRYKMVLHPIEYRNEESPKRALIRIISTWVFSIAFYGPVTLFWDNLTGYSNVADGQCDVEFRDIVWLNAIQSVVEFVIPLLIISYCNVRLFLYIRERRKRMMQLRITQTQGEGSHYNEMTGKVTKRNEEREKNIVELQEFRKEHRAARSLMILVGTYFIFWFWYEIVGNFVDPICKCVPSNIYEASYWPMYHIPGINPIIYAITIERFRFHFKTFFSRILPCFVAHPDSHKGNKTRVGPVTTAMVHSTA